MKHSHQIRSIVSLCLLWLSVANCRRCQQCFPEWMPVPMSRPADVNFIQEQCMQLNVVKNDVWLVNDGYLHGCCGRLQQRFGICGVDPEDARNRFLRCFGEAAARQHPRSHDRRLQEFTPLFQRKLEALLDCGTFLQEQRRQCVCVDRATGQPREGGDRLSVAGDLFGGRSAVGQLRRRLRSGVYHGGRAVDGVVGRTRDRVDRLVDGTRRTVDQGRYRLRSGLYRALESGERHGYASGRPYRRYRREISTDEIVVEPVQQVQLKQPVQLELSGQPVQPVETRQLGALNDAPEAQDEPSKKRKLTDEQAEQERSEQAEREKLKKEEQKKSEDEKSVTKELEGLLNKEKAKQSEDGKQDKKKIDDFVGDFLPRVMKRLSELRRLVGEAWARLDRWMRSRFVS